MSAQALALRGFGGCKRVERVNEEPDPQEVNPFDYIEKVLSVRRHPKTNALLIILQMRGDPSFNSRDIGCMRGTICFRDGTTYSLNVVFPSAPRLSTGGAARRGRRTFVGSVPLDEVQRMWSNPLPAGTVELRSGRHGLRRCDASAIPWHLPPAYDDDGFAQANVSARPTD